MFKFIRSLWHRLNESSEDFIKLDQERLYMFIKVDRRLM